MTRIRTAIVIALVIAGLVLPARGLAIALVGSEQPQLSAVIQGVWIFKFMLLVHAFFLWAAHWWALPMWFSGPLVSLKLGADEKHTPTEPLILGGLIAVAVGLRLYDLGNGLWLDEIAALVKYVRLPLGQLVSTFDSQNQHMLYALMAGGSVGLLGESAATLRLPAVLFGVGSVVALYWFGLLVATRREALLAAALMTISYHHVWFSQNARGYTGLLMWTLIGTALFLKVLSTRERQGWSLALGYGLTMALATYTHATAALIVVTHALIWLVLMWRSGNPQARRAGLMAGSGLLLAGTISLQLYALILPQLVDTLSTPTMAGVSVEWKSPIWFLAETLRGLTQALPGSWLTLLVGFIVAAAGLGSYVKRNKIVASVMVLPAITTVVVLLATKHNLWPRFFFFSAGFALLIVVRGIFELSRVVLKERHVLPATVVTTGVIVASLWTLPAAYGPKQDYEGARDYVAGARMSVDAVVTLDLAAFPFRDYLAEDWLSVDSQGQLEAIERSHPKTWVLYTFPSRLAVLQPDIWKRLQDSYSTAAEFPGTVGGGTVVIMLHESDRS